MDRYEVIDSEVAYQRFQELIEGVDDDELLAWKAHDCTKALLWGLVHSEMVIMESWRNGKFTDQTKEGTDQQNAKALGMIESIGLMKQYILEEISKDDNSNGTPRPY